MSPPLASLSCPMWPLEGWSFKTISYFGKTSCSLYDDIANDNRQHMMVENLQNSRVWEWLVNFHCFLCSVLIRLWFLIQSLVGCLSWCGFPDFHSLLLLFLYLLRRRNNIHFSTYSVAQADTDDCPVWPILCYLELYLIEFYLIFYKHHPFDSCASMCLID